MSCTNFSITSEYLTSLQRKKGAPDTCTGRDMNSHVDVILKSLPNQLCHKTNVLAKFQRYISIFGLVTEEKRLFRYLCDLAWTGRSLSFPPRCKSQIILIISSATKLMSCPNFSIASRYWTYLQRKNGALNTWAMEHGPVTTRVSHLHVSLKSFLLSLVQ